MEVPSPPRNGEAVVAGDGGFFSGPRRATAPAAHLGRTSFEAPGAMLRIAMYEPVTRIPLLLWSPSLFAGGRRIREKCQLFDLAPTILDLAGAEHPKPFQARSLLPALNGEAWAGRDFVFSEQAGDVAMTGTRLITMVRDNRWKVVFIHGAEDGQLFDLATDPLEQRNLWDLGEHAGQISRLKDAFIDWRQNSLLETMDLNAAVR